MSETPRFNFPLIAAAQAQKHVTHNEALARIDKLIHISLRSRTTMATASVSEGDAYLVPESASGLWSGAEGQIAFFNDGIWSFVAPKIGMTAFIEDEAVFLVCDGTGWRSPSAGSSAGPTAETVLAEGTMGAKSLHRVIEAELTGLSGATVSAPGLIPNRAIVFCVSTRTSSAISGASAYDCGVPGEQSKFGGYLGISQGASNLGVIGPTAFYSPTDVVLTAQTGAFTGGAVKVAVHCFVPEAPS